MQLRNEASYRGRLFRHCRDLRHARGWATVPLIASEIYAVCHEMPVLFEKRGDAWSVVGLLGDPALRAPRLRDDGSWAGDYSPFMLRIHPFRLGPDGVWDVAPEGIAEPPARGNPFFAADGRLSPAYARVKAMLLEATDGLRRLSALASALEGAGLLVPVATGYLAEPLSETVATLFCIDRLRLARTRAPMLARLAEGTPSALDLAFSSVHSMRLVAGDYPRAATADLETRIASLIGESLGERGQQRDDQAGPPPNDDPPAPLMVFDLDRSETIDFSRLY
ncbi:SapC family protein [Alsobacter sp. R-9]